MHTQRSETPIASRIPPAQVTPNWSKIVPGGGVQGGVFGVSSGAPEGGPGRVLGESWEGPGRVLGGSWGSWEGSPEDLGKEGRSTNQPLNASAQA